MKLSKSEVCVEILSQDHAQEAEELLQKYNENIDTRVFPLVFKTSVIPNNYLQFFNCEEDWGLSVISPFEKKVQINLSELEQILINSNGK